MPEAAAAMGEEDGDSAAEEADHGDDGAGELSDEERLHRDYVEALMAINHAWAALDMPEEERDPAFAVATRGLAGDKRSRRLSVLAPDGTPAIAPTPEALASAQAYYDGLTAALAAAGGLEAAVQRQLEAVGVLWEALAVPAATSDRRRAKLLAAGTPERQLRAIMGELGRLQFQLDHGGSVLPLIAKRQKLLVTWAEFERNAQDPSRFKGSSIRLVQEAKFRQQAGPKLQKLEDELCDALRDYKDAHKLTFVYGKTRNLLRKLRAEISQRPSLDAMGVLGEV